MAKIISVGRDNLFKNLWFGFNSLSLFTKLLVITLILLTIAIPFSLYNQQLLSARGQSESQRLQEIAQLQQSQRNLQNAFTVSSGSPDPSAFATKTVSPAPNKVFNLIDSIYGILIYITQIFNQ